MRGNRQALQTRLARIATRLALIACAVLSMLVSAAPVAQAQSGENTSALAAGGLVIAPSPYLTLEQHDLVLSIAQIRSTMVLRSVDRRPRDVLIAFPLPDVEAAAIGEGAVAFADTDPGNFVRALITADGQPVATQLQQRAFALELDVTNVLIEAGIPLFPFGEAVSAALSKLDEARRSDLVVRGVLREEDSRVLPNWMLKSTAFWRQTFAPGRTVTLSLAYQPAYGRLAYVPAAWSELERSSCVDPAFREDVEKKAADGKPPLELLHFNYAASRGIVWWEPAQRFRLIVEAPDIAHEVSLCGVALQQTAPGTFEWSGRDALPEDDLFVVFAR